MITFDRVTKKYGDGAIAVDDLSFSIKEGDLVVLLGPSGCGKTTLLRMINRMESITKGKILIDGKSIQDIDSVKLRKGIGYVIQDNGLFSNMTIEDNVTIVLDLLGWSKKEKNDRYCELMKLIGLEANKYRKRYPNELSGGQKQRIGFARALAADPPIMLMDEPFGALDPINREKLQDEFKQIQAKIKKTIVFVSHDLDEAMKMGDKIKLMNEGKIMQYDTPSQILNHPANEFVSEFIGKNRFIKSLNLYTAKELVEEVELDKINETIKVEETGKVLVQQTLQNMLSTLLNERYERVIVIGENKENLGSVTIGHIQRFLHKKQIGE